MHQGAAADGASPFVSGPREHVTPPYIPLDITNVLRSVHDNILIILQGEWLWPPDLHS